MVFLKENLINCLKSICPKEYDLKYFVGVVYFENKSVDKIKKIEITFAHYFPHSITFTGVSTTIEFFLIENQIKEKSNQLGLEYSSDSSIRLFCEQEKKISDIRIENTKDFKEVEPQFEKIINNDCLPLLKKYESLNEVANLLSVLTPQEVVPYIQGAKLFCKTILILKEAKHPNYKSKRDEFYEVLKRQATKKEVYAQQLQLFELLFFTQQP